MNGHHPGPFSPDLSGRCHDCEIPVGDGTHNACAKCQSPDCCALLCSGCQESGRHSCSGCGKNMCGNCLYTNGEVRLCPRCLADMDAECECVRNGDMEDASGCRAHGR